MKTSLVTLDTPEAPWAYHDGSIVVGKDILEVLSSAMYVDPLAIYREYIQNAADAIDEASITGVLGANERGVVEIEFDFENRSARIRDNGLGIPHEQFEARMISLGASTKYGTAARGFRGVGRLSGLAYCHELLFRSRFAGESYVSELRWDCRKAKSLLRSRDFLGDLTAVVTQSVQVRRIGGKNYPDHFFEVEMRGVSRLRNDLLLNPTVIEQYLSQVAPLPFAPEFKFGESIAEMLHKHVALANVTLKIAANTSSTFRPHRDSFEIPGGHDQFEQLQEISIPGVDGGIAAVGWILHHGYRGVVPNAALKGLRLRSGNIQVGGNDIVEDLFTEGRFNSWCVGEIHAIDSRIIPNGRRDHYEQNIHYMNLINQLSPIAREISSRCRQSSIRRNWIRQFERNQDHVRRNLQILKQGALGSVDRREFSEEIERLLDAMEKSLAKGAIRFDAPLLGQELKKLRREFEKSSPLKYEAKVLSGLSPQHRKAYEQVFGLLYECSPDKGSAKLLVDRVLARLQRLTREKL
jgi:molecular chaperone HtpG